MLHDKIDQQRQAKNIIGVIYYATNLFMKGVTGNEKDIKISKELKKLVKKHEDMIVSFTLVCHLFEALQYFWKKINNKKEYQKLHKNLINTFKDIAGFNPEDLIQEISGYIGEKDFKYRRGAYFGMLLLKDLEQKGAILMFEINTHFLSRLKYGFFESLQKAWDLKNE